ncbi:MAG: hypothetical protein OXB84_06435, partial [Halobacteriovoraceae bacterium]|nr:hypothetical protein [Halobacteriovoraceae bacterium]
SLLGRQPHPTPPGAPDPSGLGHTDVKLIDLYLKKTFGSFTFAVEMPLLSGQIGDVYGSKQGINYKARAIIFESSMKLGNSWKIGFDWGKVNGDNGSTGSFDAMYLHPNYQIANVLFRYNRKAVADPDAVNIYDSHINNATYFKFHSEYNSGKWTFRNALIMASADEVAKASDGRAFNHLTNVTFTPGLDQESDLGLEFDFNMDYRWNTETTIGMGLGYLFSGDYFAYTNDPAVSHEAENSFVIQLNTSVKF